MFELAAEGKEILRRKLKAQKINLNEDTVNKLVTFFKLKTSLDLFYHATVLITRPSMKLNLAHSIFTVLTQRERCETMSKHYQSPGFSRY